jgi:hypothetical protein
VRECEARVAWSDGGAEGARDSWAPGSQRWTKPAASVERSLLFDGAADGMGGRGSRSSSEVERIVGGVGSDCDWRRIALGRGAGGGDVARIAAG